MQTPNESHPEQVMNKVYWLGLVLSFCLGSQLRADIVLTLEPNLSLLQNSGVQQLNLYANSTTGSDVAVSTMVGILTIDSADGQFVVSPFTEPGFTSGTFNFGTATLLASISSADSYSDIDPGDPRSAAVNIVYDSPPAFTTTPSLLGSFSFDVGALTPGVYSYSIVTFATGEVVDSDPPTLDTLGTIEVTAVPEPTSMVMAAVSCGGLLYRRSRRRIQKDKFHAKSTIP